MRSTIVVDAADVQVGLLLAGEAGGLGVLGAVALERTATGTSPSPSARVRLGDLRRERPAGSAA